MNRKAQALVEFVLILPILLLLLLAFFDIAKIISCRMELESKMDDCITLLREEKIDEIPSYLQKSKYIINFNYIKDDYLNISLQTKIDILTPGLKNIIGNPYNVLIERSVLYENEL